MTPPQRDWTLMKVLVVVAVVGVAVGLWLGSS